MQSYNQFIEVLGAHLHQNLATCKHTIGFPVQDGVQSC